MEMKTQRELKNSKGKSSQSWSLPSIKYHKTALWSRNTNWKKYIWAQEDTMWVAHVSEECVVLNAEIKLLLFKRHFYLLALHKITCSTDFLSYGFKKIIQNGSEVGRYQMEKLTNSKHRCQASCGENRHRALEEITSLNPVSNDN